MLAVGELPDPDWYFDHVLAFAEPGTSRLSTRGPAEQWQDWWRARITDSEPMRTAARQGFVVSASQLRGLGVTRSAVRAAVKRGSWLSVGRGCIAPVVIDDDAARWLVDRRLHALAGAAEALRRAGHVISSGTSAILHGLPTMAVPTLPQLTEGKTVVAGRRSPAHVFAARLDRTSVTTWFGALVTTVARTIVDQGRHDRRDGIMVADAALRESLVMSDDVRRELDDAQGWPGIRQARRVWELASPLAESPLESITRLALLDDGFPPPVLQHPIGPYRVDICWPKKRFVIEADGEGKYFGDALRDEKRREHYLHVQGWRVERVMWRDVLGDWPRTSARLWRSYHAT